MFGDNWTEEFANENHLNIYHPSVFVDAYFGAETNYTWTKLDGSPLNYTNWGWREPHKINNVVLLRKDIEKMVSLLTPGRQMALQRPQRSRSCKKEYLLKINKKRDKTPWMQNFISFPMVLVICHPHDS